MPKIQVQLVSITQGAKDIYPVPEPFDPLKEVATTPYELLKPLFKKYGYKLNEEEATVLHQILLDYYNNKSTQIYDRLPKPLQRNVDGMCRLMINSGIKNVTREDAAKAIIDRFVNDSVTDAVFAKLDLEQVKMNTEIIQGSDKAFEDVFAQQEELSQEDPSIGERIQVVKDAFSRANTFDLQLQYLRNDRAKNVKRYHQHYNGDIVAFNNKANSGKFTIPKLDAMYQLLKIRLPKEKHYTTDEIKAFIVLLARSMMNLDYEDLGTVAYAYRRLDSLIRHTLKYNASEGDNKVFEDVATVIDEIRSIIRSSGRKDK